MGCTELALLLVLMAPLAQGNALNVQEQFAAGYEEGWKKGWQDGLGLAATKISATAVPIKIVVPEMPGAAGIRRAAAETISTHFPSAFAVATADGVPGLLISARNGRGGSVLCVELEVMVTHVFRANGQWRVVVAPLRLAHSEGSVASRSAADLITAARHHISLALSEFATEWANAATRGIGLAEPRHVRRDPLCVLGWGSRRDHPR